MQCVQIIFPRSLERHNQIFAEYHLFSVMTYKFLLGCKICGLHLCGENRVLTTTPWRNSYTLLKFYSHLSLGFIVHLDEMQGMQKCLDTMLLVSILQLLLHQASPLLMRMGLG